MKTFFIGDTHFSHKNIIKYEDRPFQDENHMDYEMIKNWNSVVGKNDRVFILGDFCMDSTGEQAIKIANQLNGQKFLIRGNHDYWAKNKEASDKFGWIKDYYLLKHNGYKIALFHYPIAVWDCKHHGSVHLYGHIHSNRDNHHPLVADIGLALNVGVDVNDFKPLEWSEICKKLGIDELNKR